MKKEVKNNNTMGNKSKEIVKNKNITISKFKDLEGKFLHIKVGNTESPASAEQIFDIQKNIVKLFLDNNVNCLTFVTHHAVSMDVIEKQINGV